jgi:glutathione synthase/RimK-type ligase-like ATP-grasp enzyme
MKIAIHNSPYGFHPHWLKYCERKNIPYKIVNAYDSDIVNQLKDCDAFMWHFSHINYKDMLFARQLLYSIQLCGIKVFPDFNTAWHFDDKVGQKYLLEAIGAPLAPGYVFYKKKEAIRWVGQTTFPKVFKLRGGAGASNVHLARNKQEALQFINKAFGRGFKQYDAWGSLKERWRFYHLGKTDLKDVIKGIVRFVYPTDFARFHGHEKGYVYFQEFIPNNKTDFRIKIVGNKCWGFQRGVRDNDFRASGSGNIIYNFEEIPISMIKIAFSVCDKLCLQSVAFDFVLKDGIPLIVEMSYGFGVDDEEFDFGYWDSSLEWHKGKFNPYGWMVEDVLERIHNTNTKMDL